MNKKFLSLVLALVMVLGAFTSVFAAEAEKKEEVKKEVPKLTASDAKIRWLVDNKIVEGRKVNEDPKNNDLALDKNIQRAEVTKLLVFAIGKADLAEKLQGAMEIYPDVKADYWANGFISVGSMKGNYFLNGYPDKTFKPKNDVTNAELAKMLVVLVDKLDKDQIDKMNKDWPKSWMAAALKLGILDGVDNIKANDPAVRKEAFVMIYNAMYQLKDLRVLPANETMGVISERSNDKKLVLNQGEFKKEFKVDNNTVFVQDGLEKAPQMWLSANLVAQNYYVGSFVRVLTDKDGVVTHIIQLGNPELGAINNTGWKSVADKTTEIYSSVRIDSKLDSITFQREGLIYTNSKTRYFVADADKGALTEVKDKAAALAYFDGKDALDKVYAGYDVMPTSGRKEATVVVFNKVYVDGFDTEVVRVVTPGDTTFKLMVEMPGFSKTEAKALSTRMNDKVFPFNYNLEKYDVFKAAIKEDAYVGGRPTPVEMLIDHSEAPIHKVTGVKYKDVDGLQATPQKRIDTITLTDGKGTQTFDVLIDAKNFFTDEVKVGQFVQVHYLNAQTLDIISVVPDTGLRGELPNGKDNRQVTATVVAEPVQISGSEYYTVTVKVTLDDGQVSNYTTNFVTKETVENGREYTFIADQAKHENHNYPYASNFKSSIKQVALDEVKKLENAPTANASEVPTARALVQTAKDAVAKLPEAEQKPLLERIKTAEAKIVEAENLVAWGKAAEAAEDNNKDSLTAAKEAYAKLTDEQKQLKSVTRKLAEVNGKITTWDGANADDKVGQIK